MYLIYFILCDIIPLILATNNYYYVSETNLPSVPSELDIHLLVNNVRTKRDTLMYTEAKIPSSTTAPPMGLYHVTEIPHAVVSAASPPITPPATPAPPPSAAPTKKNDNHTSSHTNINVLNHPTLNITMSTSNKANLYNTLNQNVTNGIISVTSAPRSPSLHTTVTDILMQMQWFNFSSLPPEITNDMLKQNNINQTKEDSHVYYNSTRTDDPEIGKHYWVDMNNRPDVTNHSMLSHSHRRAVTVTLPFKFQFYGHEIENVTIATGGFLYTGDYIHSWLAATQYIAPLMANFDTSLSNDSNVKYVYNSTAFTVLWENVSLQDQPNSGNFTFEVTLKSNGDIIFVYHHIPQITADLTDHFHPVKIGLSDAYIMDRTIFFVRRKTIFEYHRVQFDKKDLKNGTVIYLKPLPTCQTKTTCESCLTRDVAFECQWCDNRCSNGFDRRRHDWMKKECDKKRINETKYCSLANEKIPTPGAHKAMNFNEEMPNESGSKSGIFLTIVTIGCILSVFIWILYAYRNPHSTSGQILIRYRPSQWSGWRKGEARYTAATIHM